MKIRAIITGATGMVGEGVLHEALERPDVESVLVINRRPCGVVHEKLKEIIHKDFLDFSAIEPQLINYNACFFCLGVSSVGLKEPEYKKMTYDLTLHVATTLVRLNPTMTFCYVSGAGTASSEKGSMWARVKGKTENDLLRLPFKNAFMFRPAFIEPTKGLKNTLKLYRYVGWVVPIIRMVAPNYISSLRDIGAAMIKSVTRGSEKQILEVTDIKKLANS
jgi:uncharacterized protein YbjT (DUF2867 family)